jgi:Arc/MetJ-type ribon-helix-helix transcriptional regulator
MVKDVDMRERIKVGESEKLTINLGYIDLGEIDLLVREGFYSNRTDLIRTAIRNQLDRHRDALSKSVTHHRLDLGLRRYELAELQALAKAGERISIQALGLVVIAEDVSADLVRDVIASVHVLGAFHASAEVKAALADRIR